MKIIYLNLFIIALSLNPISELIAEPAPISKAVEYLKIIGYDKILIDNFDDCVKKTMEMKPENEIMLSQSIASIEAKRGLKPASLGYSKTTLNILSIKLDELYNIYTVKMCTLSKDENKLNIFATEYAKYLTNEEIDEIIAFAKTPAGKKGIMASKNGADDAYNIIWANKKTKQKKADREYYSEILTTIEKYLVQKNN